MLTANEFKPSERKTEKHEIRLLNCGGGLKTDENWMSAETSCVRGVARGQKDMAGDQCALKVKVASLNRMRHNRRPTESFEDCDKRRRQTVQTLRKDGN